MLWPLIQSPAFEQSSRSVPTRSSGGPDFFPGSTDLRWYGALERGGHFAAFEQPEIFVDEVRGFFRTVR